MTLSKAAATAAMMIALGVSPAWAQPSAPDAAAADQTASRDDATLQVGQPDFTLTDLPTALRLPVGKLAFRVTHRFRRSLGQGDVGDLASDAFGLDNGSFTALELRFGLLPGTQVGVHRSGLDKTIEFFAQQDLIGQGRAPLGVAVWASIDGTGNFTDSYTPAIGAILSRVFGDAGAVYVEPIWINNSNPLPSEVVDNNNTVVIGLGARVRLPRDAYLVGEWSPRVAGYGTEDRPIETNVDAIAFAIEKRVGGHMFQINFSNSFATTMGQIARGGFSNDDWYLGFNITRKFF